jgi:hypothetical protein
MHAHASQGVHRSLAHTEKSVPCLQVQPSSPLIHSRQCTFLRNPVIPVAAESSSAPHRLRRSAMPAAARPRAVRQAEPSRPPREPSRVFENMSRSLSNARQAVAGFFSRVTAQRPQQPVVTSPALAPAPAISASPAISSGYAQPAGSPVSPAPLAIVASPVAGAGPTPVSRTSRLSSSCLPFGSFASSSGADEGSLTSSLLTGNSDPIQARVHDEPCSDPAEVQAPRPSLWRSFSSLWRDKSARCASFFSPCSAVTSECLCRGRGYQDMTRGPPS